MCAIDIAKQRQAFETQTKLRITSPILLVVFLLRAEGLPEFDDDHDVIFEPFSLLKGKSGLHTEVVESRGIDSLS